MNTISLTTIQIAHFRSFVAPTVIDLTTDPGLKLITGDNQAEPRLGANGCGKSTIWDAVCFALYGTSVKGLRASDLTSYGQQTIEVMLFLVINDEAHIIHRAAPPMRIFLDDKLVEQADIDALIGLSKARFLNSVIFGQATPLFIDLPTPARGDLLDEVLDLELWMRAADRASEHQRETGTELNECRRAIAETLGRLEGLGDIARFAEQSATWETQKQERLNTIINEFEAEEGALHKLNEELTTAALVPVDEDEPRTRYEHMRDQHIRARERLVAINSETHEINRDQQFFADHDVCPTCDQPITDQHFAQYQARVAPRLEELGRDLGIVNLDIQTTADESAAYELTWRGIVRKNQEIRSSTALLKQQIEGKEIIMSRLEEAAERVSQEVNPFATEAERTAQEHQRLSTLLADQRYTEIEFVNKQSSLDFWRQGFRKVRLFCLDNVLAELTVETRNSLLALGLIGWRVDFKTASETKAGTLRLGVQVDILSPETTIHSDTPVPWATARKFEMLSGGESQRARLAVSLGLANLIQRWAGVRFDVEVFDEPTAWLSEQGVEDLLDALHARADANNRSIWVCDHRALIYSGFREIINVIKTEEGSRIAA